MNILRDFHYVNLQTKDWGEIKLLKPVIKKDDIWGSLGILKGTFWEEGISIITVENYEHAVSGWGNPLANELGPSPEFLVKKIPKPEGFCALKVKDQCAIASSKCFPGKHVPECYEAQSEDSSISMVASLVVMAWKEGRHVVVIKE